jgi:hypothetical protein
MAMLKIFEDLMGKKKIHPTVPQSPSAVHGNSPGVSQHQTGDFGATAGPRRGDGGFVGVPQGT